MIDETPLWSTRLSTYADQFHDQWVAMRRHLHQNPELSGREHQTTEYLAAALGKLELPIHVAGEGRGVTADLVSSANIPGGKRISIRGDIDALPITDTKSVEYRSQCDGVMHACGHDVHATIVFGAMQVLSALHHAGELPWPISVRAILQPSEEHATGARHMIHHHALRDVNAIIAVHVDPTRSVGCIGLRSGVLCAAVDILEIKFTGRGGHGARPHLAIDPIDACTHWLQSAYRRVSRTADPHQTIVLSFGQIEAGHSANVIPDTALLRGSLRSLDAESRRVAMETLEDVCESIRKETQCKVEMRLGMTAPAVVNDPVMTKLLGDSIDQTLSPGAMQWIDQPSMGSEDFSFYLEHVPGAMFRIGVAGDQVGRAGLHTSTFDVDERSLAIGVKLFVAAVIRFFDPQFLDPQNTVSPTDIQAK